MRPSFLLAVRAYLSGLALLALTLGYKGNNLRDALSEADMISGDVQGLVQDLKKRLPQETPGISGKALGEAGGRCLRLDVSHIDEEYRFLYRTSGSPPEKIFAQGFISRAEKASWSFAPDANIKTLDKHLGFFKQDPFIATTESASAAKHFAAFHLKSWIYLIHTNRGVRVLDQVKAKKLIYALESEQEVAVPGRIPPWEIVGAWPSGGNGIRGSNEDFDLPAIDFYKRHSTAQFGSFIKNPRYSGSLQIAGDICPPFGKNKYGDSPAHAFPY